MKMTTFWDIVLCGLVEVDQRFRGEYSLHRHGDDGPLLSHLPPQDPEISQGGKYMDLREKEVTREWRKTTK
jgi:hypothetical protein